jgi:hypothetical protein
MRQKVVCLALAAGIMMLGACKEKKQTGDIITSKYEPKALVAPIKMEADRQSKDIVWQGKPYRIDIQRAPADSLPKLKDDSGQEYVDNMVAIKITRSDGSQFFQKSFFGKSNFTAYLDEPFKSNGQLVGIRFNEADNSGLEFSVVVGMPDAPDDLFVPLELVVDRQGSVRVEKDDDMDMLDYDDDYDDNDD